MAHFRLGRIRFPDTCESAFRYVDANDKIHENLIELVNCDSGVTGVVLADKIINNLKDKHGLNI